MNQAPLYKNNLGTVASIRSPRDRNWGILEAHWPAYPLTWVSYRSIERVCFRKVSTTEEAVVEDI